MKIIRYCAPGIFGCVLLMFTITAHAEDVLDTGAVLLLGAPIRLLDMSTKQETQLRIEGLGEVYSLRGYSKIDDSRLLAVFHDGGEFWIYDIDLERRQATKLVRGAEVVSLRGHNKFLFISRSEDSPEYLYIANMDVTPVSIRKVYEISTEAHNRGYLPVQVSKDKVLFAGPRGDEHKAYEIDINSLKYKPSAIGECVPFIWFDSRKQLLCRRGHVEYENYFFFTVRKSQNPYVLTSLDGKHHSLWNDEYIKMDWTEGEAPLSHSPETDVLLVKKPRRSFGYGVSLYAYDLKKHKQKRLWDGMIYHSEVIIVK